jgi:hypothetical protein
MLVFVSQSFKLSICFVFEKGESAIGLPQYFCDQHCLGSQKLGLVLGNSDLNWHYTLVVGFYSYHRYTCALKIVAPSRRTWDRSRQTLWALQRI